MISLSLSLTYTHESHRRINFGHNMQVFYNVNNEEGVVNNCNHNQANSTERTYLLQDTKIRVYHQEEENGRRGNKPREPSLVKALAKSFGEEFTMTGVLKFFQDLLNFVSPLLLKYVGLCVCCTIFCVWGIAKRLFGLVSNTTSVGRESYHGTKELFNQPQPYIALKAGHLGGSTLC